MISKQIKKEKYNKIFDDYGTEQNTDLILQPENEISNSNFKKLINKIKRFFERITNKK